MKIRKTLTVVGSYCSEQREWIVCSNPSMYRRCFISGIEHRLRIANSISFRGCRKVTQELFQVIIIQQHTSDLYTVV